jgi:hypothetical protein
MVTDKLVVMVLPVQSSIQRTTRHTSALLPAVTRLLMSQQHTWGVPAWGSWLRVDGVPGWRLLAWPAWALATPWGAWQAARGPPRLLLRHGA